MVPNSGRNKSSIFTYIFRASFSFQTSSIRLNQNKIFKNRVFVKILQSSKKYEFNKARSIDHSVVFKISIFCLFIDEDFSFCERISSVFLNLFLSNLFKKHIYLWLTRKSSLFEKKKYCHDFESSRKKAW